MHRFEYILGSRGTISGCKHIRITPVHMSSGNNPNYLDKSFVGNCPTATSRGYMYEGRVLKFLVISKSMNRVNRAVSLHCLGYVSLPFQEIRDMLIAVYPAVKRLARFFANVLQICLIYISLGKGAKLHRTFYQNRRKVYLD